ncbi:hypothetical protein GSF22_14860, partial [Micromonospora echinofusca]|nr:hypothetical protein [Micromonospora echinofusca]
MDAAPAAHTDTAAAGPADRAAPGRSDAGMPPAGPPAWAVLPPIQRVVPDEPRLLRPESFTASLAAWRDPSYLAPLGHTVGDAEPAGTLHGAAVPLADPPPSADSPPLPLASPPHRPAPVRVQRLAGPATPLLTAPAPTPTRHLPAIDPTPPTTPLPDAPTAAEVPPIEVPPTATESVDAPTLG